MKEILSARVWITAVLIAIALLILTLVYDLVARPGLPPLDLQPASAALTIIPPPTGTPRAVPPTATPLPPTPTPIPTLQIGEFGIGVYVRVDTGGDALRVRAEPGLNAAPLFLAFDEEVFLISDGPRQADGYTWWYLTASYDPNRVGWAAQDFLTVVSSP